MSNMSKFTVLDLINLATEAADHLESGSVTPSTEVVVIFDMPPSDGHERARLFSAAKISASVEQTSVFAKSPVIIFKGSRQFANSSLPAV